MAFSSLWFWRKKDEFMEALGLPTSRNQNLELKLQMLIKS